MKQARLEIVICLALSLACLWLGYPAIAVLCLVIAAFHM